MNFIAFVPALATAFARALAIATSAPAVKPVEAAPGWFSVFSNPLVAIPALVIVASMLFGNKGKKADEKVRLEMLKNLKRGDRIQTIGGILGAVVRAEETRVEVKVDESSNVKIWFARTAISKVVEADKADAK